MSEGFIKSCIQINIPSFAEKFVNNKKSTFYSIDITNIYSNKKWTLEKEFDDFTRFQENLNTIIPNPPLLDGKSLFKVTAYDALQKRQLILERFLRECCVRKDIFSNRYFKEFINLEENSPELLTQVPKKLSEFCDLPLGVRDFKYIQEENVIILVCSDMNISSRIDAYITNVNLPWEEKTDAHISVGAFFAFKVIYDPNKGFKFKKVFAKSFPEQTGVVNYDPESHSVNVGLDTGRIIFYKVNPDSDFKHFEPYIDFKPHTNRVMGVCYDAKTGYIYSVSTDKKFYVTEIGYLDNPSEIIDNPSGFTNLYFDRKNERMFLTDQMGMISVYLTNSFPPILVNSIQISSDDPIRGFDINLNKNYLFTCSTDGQITILDLDLPGKEKLIKEISNFGVESKLRVIKYIMEKNEAITGDENGRIIIWNLKIGKSIFIWLAHDGAVTQIDYIHSLNLLITSGKDKFIRTWYIPDKWISDDVKKFEENEIKNMSDTLAMLRLQKSLRESEDYNSDEDSLNGWDFKPDLDDY